MNQLILGFKQCAHQAGQTCGLTNGQLIRQLGLGDFLANKLMDSDAAPDIVVKALGFFCDELDPREVSFRFAVLTVTIFLNGFYSTCPLDTDELQQPMRDLVSILTRSANESQLRRWIDSHFDASP